MQFVGVVINLRILSFLVQKISVFLRTYIESIHFEMNISLNTFFYEELYSKFLRYVTIIYLFRF